MWNFAWWYYTLSFTCSWLFQWPRFYFKVTAVSNSFNWKCYVLFWFKLKLCTIVRYVKQVNNIPLFLAFEHIYGKKLMCFLIWQNLYYLLFYGHFSREVFQALHYYHLAWGLPMHTGFDELDLVRGHRCVRTINCKLFFGSCLLQFECRMVLTVIKKIRNSMLCVTGVYLR